MQDIYNLTYLELENLILENNLKKYRAAQIWDWLYVKKVDSFDLMTNLGKDLIEKLKTLFYIPRLDFITQSTSSDGTKKFLFGLSDKNLIECVVMNHHYGLSICVTSQVGCNIGCTFCASGILSKKRDLTNGEMLLQILEVERLIGSRIQSVVVMGIGEPFDNFKNILKFLENINSQKGLNIGQRRITVSTSGLVPKIYDFANLGLQVNLAVSFHNPFNEERSRLMRINKAFPIEKLIDSIKYYLEKTKRRVTIEYILIQDITDQERHAKELCKLFKGMNVYFNLIPYNEVIEVDYKRSSLENQLKFLDVIKKNKMDAILRKEQGHDINAACGQLRSQIIKKNESTDCKKR